MAFNFSNLYNFPWSSAFTPNAFNTQHPTGGPRPPPGFTPNLQMYPGGTFPGAFPFSMLYQGS